MYAIEVGDYIYLDRPLISGLELRLRITIEQVFTDDTTVCPITSLDLFVEAYVTSEVLFDVGNQERALFYKVKALGPRYDDGKIGGALWDAIAHDMASIAEEFEMDTPAVTNATGIAVLNNISWHERYGEVDVWY